MITLARAHELMTARLGIGQRARHSIFVSHAMRHLAQRIGGDSEMWQLVGLCHDLDYFETANDGSRHGVLAAQWLADDLPAEALDAIKAHDHRAGFQSQTILADALKLADALAIADDRLGREGTTIFGDSDAAGKLRDRLADRPYLQEMIIQISARHGVPLSELAQICATAPPQ